MSTDWMLCLPFPAAALDRGVVVCNPAAEALRPELDALLRSQLASGGRIRWSHGARSFLGRSFPVPDGSLGLVLLEDRRVDRLHDLEHRLEEASAELLHEQKARQDAEVRARAAAKAKATFLANMSHELRTPLNAILGYTEMLREEADPTIVEDLARVHGSAKRLEGLVDGVLDLARIEAGTLKVQRQEVALGGLLDELITALYPKLRAKHLGLRCQLAARPVVQTDPVRVQQIVGTLLANAIKFTEHGHIGLTSHADEDCVYVCVTDTGVGIEPAHQGRIFEAFEQGDGDAAREHDGSGMGLALCLQLAKLLGGDLGVESEPGQGSRFTLSLPL